MKCLRSIHGRSALCVDVRLPDFEDLCMFSLWLSLWNACSCGPCTGELRAWNCLACSLSAD